MNTVSCKLQMTGNKTCQSSCQSPTQEHTPYDPCYQKLDPAALQLHRSLLKAHVQSFIVSSALSWLQSRLQYAPVVDGTKDLTVNGCHSKLILSDVPLKRSDRWEKSTTRYQHIITHTAFQCRSIHLKKECIVHVLLERHL